MSLECSCPTCPLNVDIPKRKVATAWKHNFYCLAYTGQTHVPTREYERDELKNAGLGDKNAVLDIDFSQEEFKSHILDLLPRLKDAGGYRFLKGNVIYSYYLWHSRRKSTYWH